MLQNCFLELECQRMDRYSSVQHLSDGASWSTVVEEGEPIDAAGSGATTLTIRAMTSGAGRSTLDGGLSNS
ncbi:hypothetical protein Tco_0430144 [Tanacetum coccineum]